MLNGYLIDKANQFEGRYFLALTDYFVKFIYVATLEVFEAASPRYEIMRVKI